MVTWAALAVCPRYGGGGGSENGAFWKRVISELLKKQRLQRAQPARRGYWSPPRNLSRTRTVSLIVQATRFHGSGDGDVRAGQRVRWSAHVGRFSAQRYRMWCPEVGPGEAQSVHVPCATDHRHSPSNVRGLHQARQRCACSARSRREPIKHRPAVVRVPGLPDSVARYDRSWQRRRCGCNHRFCPARSSPCEPYTLDTAPRWAVTGPLSMVI
jgi:hypothetical protein